VEILLYSAILFTSKFADHVIAAKCPYDETRKPILRRERWKEILINI